MTSPGSALPIPILHTARLKLRAFTEADAAELFALQSNANVLRYWDSPPWEDRATADRFIVACARMAEEGTGVRLAIELSSDASFLGWCTFNSWNPEFRSASLGYCFNEKAWGHGYATEAVAAVLDWAYTTLDLNRVQAEADTRNIASARVLEKLRFQLEGTLRQDCTVKGDTSDSWVFGLLRKDWEEHQQCNKAGKSWTAKLDEPVPEDVARLLATVPEWFGQPEANDEYIQAAHTKETWTVRDQSGAVLGITLVDRHFAHVAEIHLTLVDRQAHGTGVGTAMMNAIEADARARGVRLLEVKTLGASHPDVGYARTRHFYERCGFLAVEETDLWGPGTPCLIMVKPL